MAALPKIIAVASGKGGVGKTNVTLNLAWALARMGHRVCLFDADLGLSNVDVLLGIQPERTLDQVLFEGLPLEQVILPVATGIDLVPGSSGVARMAELTRTGRARLVREFAALSRYDYVLVDNSPGISPQVLALCQAAQELVVVLNPEVTSLTDAYVLIKVLRERGLIWPPLVLVNRAGSAQAAELVFRRLQATAQKHLRLNCTFLGSLPEDVSVARAAALQRPVLEAFPNCPFGLAVIQAARRLTGAARASAGRAVDPASFWDETVRALQQAPPAIAGAKAPAASTAPASQEAQSMLRELEAVAVLFARLDFQGAPEPLKRIAEAGQGHVRILSEALGRFSPDAAPAAAPTPTPAPAAATPAAKTRADTVLVRCANRDMGQIVADILRGLRLTPVLASNGQGGRGGRAGKTPASPGAAGLCVLAAPEPTPPVADYLKTLGATPVLVLDESFGRSRAAWKAQPNVRAILPVPFDVPEFIRSVTSLLRG